MPNQKVLATIATDGAGEFTEKRSRFLCTLRGVATVDEAQEVIAGVRQRDWDARHHCTAFVLGPYGQLQRSNDDGEPAGTAGAPMLGALQSAEVSDVVAVVSRWFGGVLLGTGGLVRAYSKAVQIALENVGISQRQEMISASLSVSAAAVGRVENALRQWLSQRGAVLADVQYGNTAVFRLHFPPEDVDVFTNWCQQMELEPPTFGARVITETP